MTIYTLIMAPDMLIACVPEGGDLDAAIREVEDHANVTLDESEIEYIAVRLTDEPKDDDDIVYGGSAHGYLTDREGRIYDYAVAVRDPKGGTR